MSDVRSPLLNLKKKLYIETVGCQMNLLDSELVVGKLRSEGYELTDDIGQADTILYNTCSVRQHAEDKIYSALGRIKDIKRERPEVAIGVLGCMAQKDQGQILKRAPHVDVVIGPGQLERVSELLEASKLEGKPQMAVSLPRTAGSRDTVTASFAEYDPLREPAMRPNPFQAFIRIMMGCDKFCTYCIVPSVRGPEQSRPPGLILDEARTLADQGVKEITLLGQTVNSYKFAEADGRTVRLSDLLERLESVEGIERIKFITNFPNDMTDDLLQAVRDLPKVSRYLHVPAQSGCDEVLKRMKRGYTVGLYDEMLERIKQTVPGAAVSSDFIVGFCGETEASFQKSMDLVTRARFKNSFIFKYSPRLGTKADTLLIDDIPEEIKKRRNAEMLALQNAISLEDHREFIGRTVEVLVEGPSKSETAEPTDAGFGQLAGRTWCDRIVLFDGPGRLIGRFLSVEIERASTVTLYGRAVTAEVAASRIAQGVDRTGVGMMRPLADLVERWSEETGISPALRPTPAQLEAGFWTGTQHCRIGTDQSRILSWERRFGYLLPESLKAWLRLSDGFYGETGPLIHPLSAIGPMVPFARMPGMVLQPESWFELGNPNLETICLDLAYRWPGDENPLFTSGDDERRSQPRIIATGFTSWFLRLLHRGGAEFWFDPGFVGLGDPWLEHRRKVPTPPLPDRLERILSAARPLIDRGVDDRAIAQDLEISRTDLEAIVRHIQHAGGDHARSATGAQT